MYIWSRGALLDKLVDQKGCLWVLLIEQDEHIENILFGATGSENHEQYAEQFLGMDDQVFYVSHQVKGAHAHLQP